MRCLRFLTFAVTVLLLGAAPLAAQCTPAFSFSVFNDGSAGDNGAVYAWTSIDDTSTLCSCAHSGYTTIAAVYDPNGSLLGSVEGSGFSSSVSALTDGVLGNYASSGAGIAFCSCLQGYLGGGGASFTITPPAPQITGIIDYATHSNTIYQGVSSYLEIYGTALTAWGETPTPTVWGDTGLTIGPVTYASDGQVNVPYTVAANAAITSHNIWLRTARGTAMFQVAVAAPPPPSINVTSGGTAVAPGSTVWISFSPMFPQLQANLVPAAGTTLSGNVSWQVSFVLSNKGSYVWTCTWPASGPRVLAASQAWNIAAELTGGICGGTATITYIYGSYPQQTFTFTVSGQNPSPAAVQNNLLAYPPWYSTNLGIEPWYANQMVKHESGYLQFNPDGTPNFGGPNGFGVMQLDPPSSLYQIWDWTDNVSAGAALLINDKINPADSFWKLQVQNWTDFNTSYPGSAVPPPAAQTEGACTISFTPSGSQHPFNDAIAMKYYNTGTRVPYISYSGTATAAGSWSVQPLGGDGTDYVALVCNTTPSVTVS